MKMTVFTQFLNLIWRQRGDHGLVLQEQGAENLPAAVSNPLRARLILIPTLSLRMELAEESQLYHQFARSSMMKLFGQLGDHGQLVRSIVGVEFKLSIELVSVALVLVPMLEHRHVIIMNVRVLLHANLWQFLHMNVLQLRYQIVFPSMPHH